MPEPIHSSIFGDVEITPETLQVFRERQLCAEMYLCELLFPEPERVVLDKCVKLIEADSFFESARKAGLEEREAVEDLHSEICRVIDEIPLETKKLYRRRAVEASHGNDSLALKEVRE